MDWKLNDNGPIFMQIYERLTRLIAKGEFPPGGRIPTVRELAADAGVNPNTMQRSLSKLEEDGLVVTNRTAGRTVTTDTEVIDRVRGDLAKKHIGDFFANMAEIGYSEEETVEAVKELICKERNE